jgi:hypothetical protein
VCGSHVELRGRAFVEFWWQIWLEISVVVIGNGRIDSILGGDAKAAQRVHV